MAPQPRKIALKSREHAKNINRRGIVPASDRQAAKKGFTVGPMLLALFLFVVVGSAVLQIISQAQRGLPNVGQ